VRQSRIDAFFRRLDEKLGLRAEIILIGASAGSLMGHIRPSLDIDFEITPTSRVSGAKKERIQQAVMDVSRQMGIAVNFSDDVSHWSMIDFLDYRRTAKSYKKIGRLNVKLIAPEYWTIGKMTRFLELDIQDMMKIIRIKKIPAKRLIELWARALRASGLSLELGRFRRHVEFFLAKCGPKVWGKDYRADAALRLFRSAAGDRTSFG
jgi:hypothetical protein